MLRHPDDYTVQSWLPLSQTPTWADHSSRPRSAMLRVFALADGHNPGACCPAAWCAWRPVAS